MPLMKGHSKEAKASNYRKLREEGYPKAQRIAIMLSEAGESKPKSEREKKSKSEKSKSK